MKTLEGNLLGQGLRIGIVASRFNEFIVSRLIGGAEDACLRHGVKEEDMTLAWVPGPLKFRWRHRKWPKAESMTR